MGLRRVGNSHGRWPLKRRAVGVEGRSGFFVVYRHCPPHGKRPAPKGSGWRSEGALSFQTVVPCGDVDARRYGKSYRDDGDQADPAIRPDMDWAAKDFGAAPGGAAQQPDGIPLLCVTNVNGDGGHWSPGP